MVYQYIATRVNESRLGESVQPPTVDSPAMAAQFWAQHVATAAGYTPDQERLVAIHLNTRRRTIGWHLISLGTLDGCLAYPREVFRTAIVNNAHAIILMHNHPSGEPIPSDADVRVTKELVTAGRHLKMEVLDHIIVGSNADMPAAHVSLRELGMIY